MRPSFPRLHFVDQTLFSHSLSSASCAHFIAGGIMMNGRQL